MLGRFGAWGAYSAIKDGKKVCFALAQPMSEAGRGGQSNQANIFISTRPGEGTTRVRLKRCDLVACLAHVGMQVLVARPSVAREHDRRTWSPGVVAKLQARAERQDNKLGGDLSTALMPKEQQLLVSMRKVRQ